MNAIRRLWFELNPIHNPLLIRELRSRMRGPRLFLLILLFQGCLMVVLAVTWSLVYGLHYYGRSSIVSSRGHQLFVSLIVAEAMMICVIVPALSAGAFTLEREKQTLEMLLMTPLTGLQAAWGKCLGPFLVSSLLLVTSLPPAASCLFLGGVSLGEVCLCLVGLALFTLLYTAMAVAISAQSRSTAAAVFSGEVLAVMFLVAGGLEALAPGPILASALTPLSWVGRVCSPEELYAGFLGTAVPFMIPGAALLCLTTAFLLLHGPTRLVAPRPHHVALKRLVGLATVAMLAVVLVWGSLRDLLSSGVGASFAPPGSVGGLSDLGGLVAMASMVTCLAAALYANSGATGHLQVIYALGLRRGLLEGLRPRSAFAVGAEACLPWALAGWLVVPGVVLLGAALMGEWLHTSDVPGLVGLFAVELGVLLLAYFIGLGAALRHPWDLAKQRILAVGTLVVLIAYPAVPFLAWGFWNAARPSAAVDPAVWASVASPAGLLVLFACAGVPDFRSMGIGIGGHTLAPWMAGLAFLLAAMALGLRNVSHLCRRLRGR